MDAQSSSAGYVLAAALVLSLFLVALRLQAEKGRRPRNHLLLAAASIFAGTLAYRLIDVLQHAEQIRWSAGIAGWALVIFLASDSTTSYLLGRAWREATGQRLPGDTDKTRKEHQGPK